MATLHANDSLTYDGIVQITSTTFSLVEMTQKRTHRPLAGPAISYSRFMTTTNFHFFYFYL
jgi:hypothetical protein